MGSNKKDKSSIRVLLGQQLSAMGIGMRTKLIILFLVVQILPLILLTGLAWQQIAVLGVTLQEMSVEDASGALNDSAVENIERMSTDAANRIAAFLYDRDDDIRYLASLEPSAENYALFSQHQTGEIVAQSQWALSPNGSGWIEVDPLQPAATGGLSSNTENNDMDGFHYRPALTYPTVSVPLYDEITFVDLNGMERVKYVSPNSTKVNYPMNPRPMDVSHRENTYVRAETYFQSLEQLQPGEIYVSDVIGAYVGSNYIGMYVPSLVEKAAGDRGYDIAYNPEAQAYAGQENPNGQRFEGIIRWATPVTGGDGGVIGYVTFALNHDHIMEFVDHLTPMNERYTRTPSADGGNYAFIWDYQCRNICHPRHHSIVGYDPDTGLPQVPWLESSIYAGWQESGLEHWTDYVKDLPTFFQQSRSKTAAAALTQAGLVGLDGRYLNNAPQCVGWMDLTGEGGSGSFYILWSGIYKLNTAAAIPYYTGQYAPSQENDFSKRGFGFVAIGAGLDDFTRPAAEMGLELSTVISENQQQTTQRLAQAASILILVMILIAILLASSITGNIHRLILGISRFRAGEWHFRFHEPVKDEFGALADSFDDMADSIVSGVKNPLVIVGTDRQIIYMNDAALNLYEVPLSQVLGTPYSGISVYPPNSPYDPIAALQEGREAEVIYLEQRDRYFKGIANYLLDKNGQRIGYRVETLDMSDFIREQLRIETQKSLLDKVFSASPDLIWYMDANGAYLTVNPRFADIAGRPAEDFTGKTAEEILPPEIALGFAENDKKAIAASISIYSEEHLTFSDSHEETLDSVRTPIYDSGGKLLGLLGFARNVSTRVEIEGKLRQTQLELELAVSQANRANEHKGEFLARMSHEIRTPMNAIIGLTSIVQKKMEELHAQGSDMNQVQGYMDQIEASSQHLLGLLNDILDLSKIEAGHIELSSSIVDLVQLSDTVASIIRPRCEEKNIQFDVLIENFDHTIFSLDPLRLRQVLINLLGNAVKFTPECGRIIYSTRLQRIQNGKALVEFTVQDNGIGISQEAAKKIFESFEQGSSDVALHHGGTGLGLAICKRIVHLFGSEIEVESTLGAGSTFRFSLWLDQAKVETSGQPAPQNISERYHHRRLLLVDDVSINRMIVSSMLEDSGLEIDEAADGHEALLLFQSSPPGFYDIILMDIQMPRLNGYQSTQAIRALNRPDAKTVPIIALTANAFQEDVEKARSFGMNGHLAKPIELELLNNLLARYLHPRES